MKNTKLKRIISCIVFAVLLCGAIIKCADILEYKDAREKYTPFYESETNFDVIFMGTSHMWNHVLPMEMWKDYGISSYNWAYANCTPAEDYYLIQDIVKYTSPKVVVIDVYGITEYESYNNGKYRTDRIEQQHVQFDSLPIWSESKYKASKDVFDDYDNNVDFIWNFIMYHNRWTDLGEEDFDYKINTEKGAHFLTGLGTGSFTPIDVNDKTEINSVCSTYYMKLIEYCQEQGIQVLCVYLPFGSCDENAQRVANSIGDKVEGYSNCEYVNMLGYDILNYNTDVTEDDGHLNYSGASKVTSWLGQYLKDNYTLDDYSDNSSWQEDYEAYMDRKKSKIKSRTTLVDYLVQLSDDDFEAEAEIYDENLMKSDRLMLLFENAGISPEYVEDDTDKCARLIIKNKSGDKIQDVDFKVKIDSKNDDEDARFDEITYDPNFVYGEEGNLNLLDVKKD